MKSFHTALAAALLLSVAAPAVATDITVRNFSGTIEISEGPAGLEVVRQGSRGDLDYRQADGDIVIDGGLSKDDRKDVCNGPGGSWNLTIGNWNSSNDTRLEDYPHLAIRVPAGSDLDVEDSTLRLSSDVALGTAQLDIEGCFDTDLSDVDLLIVEKSGAGDLDVGNVGRFEIEKAGAGDIDAGIVDEFELEQSGAGDIMIELVTGRATIDKSGAGDVEIDEMDGDLTVEKSGAGDLDVGGGDVPNLTVRNSGAGDVDIDAAVGNAFIRASGAGDVFVESISGSLDESTSGAASFSRGDD
ncbi:MAG: DUF2807 domain-containing protein [Litorimonas sp.]